MNTLNKINQLNKVLIELNKALRCKNTKTMIKSLKNAGLAKEKIIHTLLILKFCNIVSQTLNIGKLKSRKLQIAALLHDVGHSKILEIIFPNLSHVERSVFISEILTGDSDIAEIIKAHEIFYPLEKHHEDITEKILYIADRIIYTKYIDLDERFSFLIKRFPKSRSKLLKARKYAKKLITHILRKTDTDKIVNELETYRKEIRKLFAKLENKK